MTSHNYQDEDLMDPADTGRPADAGHSVGKYLLLALIPISGIALGLSAPFFGGCDRSQPGQATGKREKDNTPLPVLFELPEFSLTERSGDTITRESLLGKVWIADFIFTTCPGPCPKMTSNMAQLQQALSDAEDLRLVSVTVDPATDTPAKLKEYADAYHALPDRWLFLTGDMSDVYELCVNGFKLAAPTSQPVEGELITHSTKFALVDRKGRIRGYYEGEGNSQTQALLDDARRLLQGEAGPS